MSGSQVTLDGRGELCTLVAMPRRAMRTMTPPDAVERTLEIAKAPSSTP